MQATRLYFKKILLLLISIQILNVGLFAQDFQFSNSTTTQEENIINSVSEYIAEVICQKKDTFPEKDGNNHPHKNHSHTAKHLSFKLFVAQTNYFIIPSMEIKSSYFDNTLFLSSFVQDIVPPPPKA